MFNVEKKKKKLFNRLAIHVNVVYLSSYSDAHIEYDVVLKCFKFITELIIAIHYFGANQE